MKIVKGNLTKSSNTFWSQFSDSGVSPKRWGFYSFQLLKATKVMVFDIK
jgi:hypothetical protein